MSVYVYVLARSRTREHMTRANARACGDACAECVTLFVESSEVAHRTFVVLVRRRLSGNLGSGSVVRIDLQEVTEET